MKLVFIFGSGAVGKMTVGKELAKLTGLRLFHNHMSIEPIMDIFGYFNREAITAFREVVFEQFAKTDAYGMIFTYMFAFDVPSEYEVIDHVKSIFAPYGTEFYHAELRADRDVRLERNKTPERIAAKPSKRDLALSETRMLRENEKHRLESLPGDIPASWENYIKIDNTNLDPVTVAKMIKERFAL